MTQQPVQSGATAASDDDKLDGSIAQTRADVLQGNVTDIADALRQRLADAGLTVSDAQFERALAEVSG